MKLNLIFLNWNGVCYLRARHCSCSGPSSSCWHRCWCSEPRQDTRHKRREIDENSRVHVAVRAFFRLPGSSWPLLCRPSAWPGGPARWTLLRRDAPQTNPACPSSWDPDRCSTLSANTHKMVCFGFNIYHSGLVHCACGRNRKLTVICLIGMKSALCRTRSKILASWGLMKASSETQN